MRGFLNDLICCNKAASTARAYESDLLTFREFATAKYPYLLDDLTKLRSNHFVQYRSFLHTRFKKRTVDRKVYSFKAFSHYLKIDGYFDENPIQNVHHTKYQLGIIYNYLEWDQVLLIIDMASMCNSVNLHRDVAFLSVLAYTGCRRGEALNLKWSDIDFYKQTLAIYRPKTRNSDILPMHPFLAERLKELYTECRGKTNGYIFMSSKGKQLSVTGVKMMIDKYVRYSGIESEHKISCHTFRHSFITHLVVSGVTIPEIQQFSGHRELSSLMPYLHINVDGKKRVIDQLPG